MCLTDKAYLQEEFREAFDRTKRRGPDMSRITETKSGYMCFHRLSIMDLSDKGMQPFEQNHNFLICNGEIYGFRKIAGELEKRGYAFSSVSDCEVLLPLYEQCGLGMFRTLDAEFALVIYDSREDTYIAARDPIGIRPLFYGYSKRSGAIMFASEAINLEGLTDRIFPFPPGYCYTGKAGAGEKEGRFLRYSDLTGEEASGETQTECQVSAGKPESGEGLQTSVWEIPGAAYKSKDIDTVCANIRSLLIDGIEKRLDADAPLGFLLSGGLDSSLVCAVSAKLLGRKIRTFAIGMEKDAIDLKYAREAADFIGAEHTEVYMTPQEVIGALPQVIRILGTWDITTIRASMGMYLCCKAIHEQTDVRVLLTGEISDELFGYKYTDFAPDAEAFQAESKKRIDELYMYDVLRADRCIGENSIEARVPFGDLRFVKYVMGIDPKLKMNTYGMGKYLLRHAFEDDHILPENILWRQKAAFSDAVGHSMVDDLKAYAQECYSDEEFRRRSLQYDYCRPFTKESLLYRELFEQYYPGQAGMISDFWMPNRQWKGCDVSDPSARVLSNYGASGE